MTNETAVRKCLAIYVAITEKPEVSMMKEYAKRFDRLGYADQEELSHLIAVHFGERPL